VIGLHPIGAWRSLVAHLLWEQGVGGSNPLAPTNNIKGLRRFSQPFLFDFSPGYKMGYKMEGRLKGYFFQQKELRILKHPASGWFTAYTYHNLHDTPFSYSDRSKGPPVQLPAYHQNRPLRLRQRIYRCLYIRGAILPLQPDIVRSRPAQTLQINPFQLIHCHQ
jgi:hypothetical protein